MKIDWKIASFALLLSMIATSIFLIFVLIPEVNFRINVNLNFYTNEDVVNHFWSLFYWIILLGSTLAFIISFAFFYTITWFEKKLRANINNEMNRKHKILLKSFLISAIISTIVYLLIMLNTYQTYAEVEDYEFWGSAKVVIDAELFPQFMAILISFAIFVCLIVTFYIAGSYLIKRTEKTK